MFCNHKTRKYNASDTEQNKILRLSIKDKGESLDADPEAKLVEVPESLPTAAAIARGQVCPMKLYDIK